MSMGVRLAVALIVALAVGFGGRTLFGSPAWVVSPEQIAAAKAAGKQGVETSPGTVAVLPIRSETADLEPIIWVLIGAGAGVMMFAATGVRRRPV